MLLPEPVESAGLLDPPEGGAGAVDGAVEAEEGDVGFVQGGEGTFEGGGVGVEEGRGGGEEGVGAGGGVGVVEGESHHYFSILGSSSSYLRIIRTARRRKCIPRISLSDVEDVAGGPEADAGAAEEVVAEIALVGAEVGVREVVEFVILEGVGGDGGDGGDVGGGGGAGVHVYLLFIFSFSFFLGSLLLLAFLWDFRKGDLLRLERGGVDWMYMCIYTRREETRESEVAERHVKAGGGSKGEPDHLVIVKRSL